MSEEIKIGGGTLHAKNGIWQAVFYVDGKQKWRSTGVNVVGVEGQKKYAASKTLANGHVEAMRAKLVEEMKNPTPKMHKKKAKPNEITLVDLIRMWLDDSAEDELRRQTMSTYRKYFEKRIEPYFVGNYPELKAKAVTPRMMQEFAAHLKASGLSANSIRRYLAPMRNATAYGMEQGVLEVNPLVNYKYSPKRTLKEKEAAQVGAREAYPDPDWKALEALLDDKKPPVRIPVKLAYYLGLRREEILGLRFGDINWDQGYLEIRNTVTKVYEVVEEENTKSKASRRRLDLTPKMRSLLWEIKTNYDTLLGRECCASDYVYGREDGSRYYPDTPDKQLKKFLKRNNLKPVGLHELRHTCCTRMITKGIDIKTVQGIMGHKDPRMTMGVYAHFVQDNVKNALALLEDDEKIISQAS